MKNIVENNKIIAEFMGFVADKFFEVKLADGINTSYYYHKDAYMYLPEAMLYNCSWDWIMTVVEKIEILENNLNKEINGDFRQFQKVLSLPIYSKIEVVYESCVEFIKWYNSKK